MLEREKVTERMLREAVKLRLLAMYSCDRRVLVYEELGLRHGSGRVDLAVVDGRIHGFELKSDKDNLKRLPAQVEIYNSVLDTVTLVVGRVHLVEASRMVPEWWGIEVAEFSNGYELQISIERDGGENPGVDAFSVAKLLWRDEALEFLVELGCDEGVRSKPRKVLYKRLVEVAELDAIRQRVCRQMESRTKWLVRVRLGEDEAVIASV